MRHDKKKANFGEMRGDLGYWGIGARRRWRRKCIFLEPIGCGWNTLEV
jgi:hypothetical protein